MAAGEWPNGQPPKLSAGLRLNAVDLRGPEVKHVNRHLPWSFSFLVVVPSSSPHTCRPSLHVAPQVKESMGGAVAVKAPETERVQQPATATPPHPSAVAPAVSAGAETAAGRTSDTTITPTTTSTGASTEASTTPLIPKVIPKVDRKVAVKGLTPYDPAAASAFLAGTAVAGKVVVPHSLGQLLQIANTCVANGQLFALCILSERACRAQQPDIDQAVSDLAAQGVTVIAVVAGADFAQRAKLAGEYCCWELPALGEALAMQADFGMDVAVASLLPGAFARKDFVPLRLPCFAFGGPHRQADVAWEAHSPVTYVSTADVDTETWALAAAMRVLPLSAPATLHGVAWARRQQLHQLSCLKAKLQLSSAGPAAAARAAVAVLEAEAAATTGSPFASSASSTSFASSASTAAASTEQLPPAYLPASLSHLVPTSVVDFRRRNARATAAGKLLAVIRVSEDAWQKHDASIRAALGAASAGSVWAEPVLLPLSLGDSCGIASPVGSRSLVPAALPALYVGGGGYLAEHWSAEADLLSGQAPAVGPTDMQEAIGLHAMRQRAWLRRREVPRVEVVVPGAASER